MSHSHAPIWAASRARSRCVSGVTPSRVLPIGRLGVVDSVELTEERTVGGGAESRASRFTDMRNEKAPAGREVRPRRWNVPPDRGCATAFRAMRVLAWASGCVDDVGRARAF